jgi:predicted transcriptional regulator
VSTDKGKEMTLNEIVQQLELAVITGADTDTQITGGYASDLLSCAMAGAKGGNVWVTLQAHPNVVAVASLLELSAVIVTEGISPDQETISKAQQANITLLGTPKDTFTVIGELAALGIRGSRPG